MITARQAAKQRRALERELARDQRRAALAKLRELREYLRAARAHRKQAIRAIRAQCRAANATRRARVKAIREQHRRAAADEITRLRRDEKATCKTRTIEAHADPSVHKAAAALKSEREHQGTLRRYSKPATLGGRSSSSTRRGGDVLAESEAEVLANIPAELVPVWHAVKGRMRETPRRSRTESFIEWASEHTADVLAIQDRQFQKDVDRIVAEEKQLAREVKRAPKRPHVDTWYVVVRSSATTDNAAIKSVHASQLAAVKAAAIGGRVEVVHSPAKPRSGQALGQARAHGSPIWNLGELSGRPRPAPPAPPVDDRAELERFAAKVQDVAPRANGPFPDRAYIGAVYDKGFRSTDRAAFDRRLVEAHRAGLLDLHRADLVGAMDPAELERSTVRYHAAEWQLIARRRGFVGKRRKSARDEDRELRDSLPPAPF